MFKTVDEAADVVTDIFIEKMADGFLEGLKGLGGKAMGGLRNAGSYMVNKGPNTLHSALGGNDAAHWGALGAIGLGGLGAAKGLVAPDEGKGRVRSMISNAALGALMGGAGGTAAGMTFPGVKNPSLGGGSIFSGNKEQHAKLQGNLDNTNADLDVNRARAVLGPLGAATAALGKAPQTGWGNAAMTAGSELAKPLNETTNNLAQSGAASLGAHAVRRNWQHNRLNKLTPGDIQISSKPLVEFNGLKPKFNMPDLFGNLHGTTEAVRTIDAGSLQDAANRAAGSAKVPPGSSTPAMTGIPPGATSVNTANMPNIPNAPKGAPAPRHDIQKIIEELKDVIDGPSAKGGPAPGSTAGSLPANFYQGQYQDLVKTHGNTSANRAALQEAINKGTDYKFKTRVPLGGTWRGLAGSQIGGQLVASQLRNLPDSIRRIRELDSSAWSRPEGLIGLGSGTPGEVQVAEQALQKFLAEQAARGGQ